ncbi:MAG TPA: magnesium transporter [Gemmatimonadales bacterium]|jgi:magnesium transporter|nr:magnesium transporter [Gemmatimonadales bacterium]
MSAPPFDAAAMAELVRAGRMALFVERAHDLEPADLADVLASLDEDERVAAVRALPPELSSQALAEMPVEEHAGETLAALAPEQAAEIVDELEDDDAADLIGELDPVTQEHILAGLEHRAEVDQLLRYDEKTAGGLMTTHLMKVRDTDSVAEALEEIRRRSEEVEDFYQIFVVDRRDILVGTLPLKQLVTSAPDRPVREFLEEADIRVAPDLDQEEVARVMARYNLASVPVVNPAGRLIGRVTFDDVTDVVEQETTEDLLRFGGVSGELSSDVVAAVRSRLPWLLINLLTAFVAKSVIDAQQDVIGRLPLIAAWLGVIAGMGGNAGTQALAVTVRRVALGLVAAGEARRVIVNELVVGALNGLANGALVAAVALLTHTGGATLGLVVGLAMVGNLIVAGASGAVIPLLLHRMRIDPAVASSIFVTTFTDVFGFGLVLFLARVLLLH